MSLTDHDERGDAESELESVSPLFHSQREFIAAVCRCEPRALRELFLAYTPLLRDQARQLGVPADVRSDLVTTLLDDVALHLQSVSTPPRELGRYLVAAIRNRSRSWHRDQKRRSSRTTEATNSSCSAHEGVVGETHSQYAIEAANPEASELDVLRSAVAKLATYSVQALSDEELHLAVGMARRVPVRELADQLSISYGAARVRVHRLRDRLGKLIRQHSEMLEGAERREVERFMRRASIDPRRRTQDVTQH